MLGVSGDSQDAAGDLVPFIAIQDDQPVGRTGAIDPVTVEGTQMIAEWGTAPVEGLDAGLVRCGEGPPGAAQVRRSVRRPAVSVESTFKIKEVPAVLFDKIPVGVRVGLKIFLDQAARRDLRLAGQDIHHTHHPIFFLTDAVLTIFFETIPSSGE